MAKEEKKGSNFLVQGSILAAAAILVRIIGLLYRIPLVNIIGKEGMAYYSSAFQIYNLILLISSYSMPTAISKMVSARMAKHEYKNVNKLLHTALFLAFGIGAVFGLLTWFGADFFAKWVLNLPLAAYPIRMLAPAIFIMAILGVFRGFFQGMQTMIPTALSQIFEQIVNALVSIGAASYLVVIGTGTDLLKGTETYANALGAAGGTLGTTAGALTALVFILVVYISYRGTFRRYVRRDKRRVTESQSLLLQTVLITILPIILSTAAYNIIDLVDNSIFGYYMTGTGQTASYETIWGTYTGMYITLIHVPVSFSSALSSSLMPSVTAAVTENDRKEVVSRVNMAIRFAMIIAIPSAVGLGVLAKPLMELLFSGSGDTSDAALYLMLGCVSVIFISLSTVTNAILQGINKMRLPVIHSCISLAVHIALLAFLLWGLDMSIYGVIFAYIVFSLCMCTLNLRSLSKALSVRQNWRKNYLLPALAAACMGIVTYLVRIGLNAVFGRNIITVTVCIIVAVALYAVLLLVFGVLDEEDLAKIPMGGRILRLAKKAHLMR